MTNYNILSGLPEEDYHALPQVGSSTVKDMSVSPAYYIQQMLAREEKGPSKALNVGSIFHESILEPGKESEYISAPEWMTITNKETGEEERVKLNRTYKEGKKVWAKFQKEAEGKTIVNGTSYRHAIEMIESFEKTPAYDRMFKGDCQTEVSIVGPDKKCRFDLLKERERGYIAYDLKTTEELPQDTNAWQRFFLKWKYHIQHAWYVDVAKEAGIEILAFHFAVVSKKPPYDYAVVRLSSDFVEYGRVEADTAYDLYLSCKKDNHWPGKFEMSGSFSQQIELPGWVK